jgi:hypothetical protein
MPSTFSWSSSLVSSEAGVADQPGATTGQGDRPVPGQLEPAQVAQLQEASDVQRWCRRVESDVGGHAACVQTVEDSLIGGLLDQPAKLPVLMEIHGDSLGVGSRYRIAFDEGKWV